MKRKSRQGVFETNSSSVHTLSIKNNGDYVLELPVDDEGNLHAYCGDFSHTGVVYGQREKMDYLATYAELYAKMYDMDVENTYLYDYALDAIQSLFPQVKKIVIHNKELAEFDHQTSPYECGFVVADYGNESFQQFLFNDSITVKMWRD